MLDAIEKKKAALGRGKRTRLHESVTLKGTLPGFSIITESKCCSKMVKKYLALLSFLFWILLHGLLPPLNYLNVPYSHGQVRQRMGNLD